MISIISNYAIILSLITIFITSYGQECTPSGTLTGTSAPPDQCDPDGSDCCKTGEVYDTYECSPQVTSDTTAILTNNNFEEGGDGGGASQCDEQYHSNDTPVVALSTGWYNEGSRCGKEIIIHGNGQTTTALVVDECDSKVGCDEEHGYQAPCRNNIVDGSNAVWEALGMSTDVGEMAITWSDA